MSTLRQAWLVRTFLVSFLVCALLIAGFPDRRVYARQTGSSFATTPGALGGVKVQSTRVAEIDSAHLRLAIDLIITPTQTATLDDLHLTELHLNGLPAFAEPIRQQINLENGKDSALPPIFITVQFRDVTTVVPLREMIEKQSVHVNGQIAAAIKMNFLDRLAVRIQHPRVSLALNEDVPIDFGASPLQRRAALGLLSVVEVGLRGSTLARMEIPGLESQWIRELREQGPANVFGVETTYSLKVHKSTYPVSFEQLGFRLALGKGVVTAEAVAPWQFDPEMLARLKSGEAKLIKKSTDIQLHTIGRQGEPLLLSQGDFRLEQRGRADQHGLIVQHQDQDDYSRINVRLRATPDTMAVIDLKGPPASGGFAVAPAATLQLPAWEKVALYRIVQDPPTGRRSIDVIQLSARRDGQAIHLDHPVDPSFFGSPILVPEGVLGIVQDEEVGAFLPADLGTAAGSAETAAQ